MQKFSCVREYLLTVNVLLHNVCSPLHNTHVTHYLLFVFVFNFVVAFFFSVFGGMPSIFHAFFMHSSRLEG